jgi:hypothetical protein
MQPRQHEKAFLRIGPFYPAALADTLSEWTTLRHRENARSTLVFHAKNVPVALPNAVGEADRFIELISKRLRGPPQPHRDHPYWLGAIAAHRWALKRIRRDTPMEARPDLYWMHLGWSLPQLIQELRVLVFGRPPYVRRWHPRWPDYRMLLDTLQTLLSPGAGTLLVVGQNTVYLRGWISQLSADAKIFQTRELLDLKRRDYSILLKRFPGSVVLVNENELHICSDLIERILPLIAEGGFLMLAIINGRSVAIHDSFAENFAYWSTQFVNIHGCVSSAEFVPVTRSQATVLHWLGKSSKLITEYPILAPLLALPVGFLTLASYAANWATKENGAGSERSGIYSSVFTVFRPVGWSRLPEFEKEVAGYWERKQINRLRAKPKVFVAPQV